MPALVPPALPHRPLRPSLRLVAGALLLVLLPLPAASQSSASIRPLAPTGGLTQARTLLASGSFPAAEAALRGFLQTDPADPDAHFLLAFTLLKEGRALDSLAAYTTAAALRPPTADDLTGVASDYILLKDYADAARWLRLATSQDPRNANAWYLLGRSAYNLDRADEAREAFLACLQLEPAHRRARYNLGLAYERLHQPAEAEAAYRQAIALSTGTAPPDSQPFLDLGMLLLSEEKPADALPLLRSAVTLAPANPLAHQQLALALEKLGRLEEAAAEMARCATLAPDSQAPPFFLGRLYHRLGRETEAKAAFARAAQLAGTHSVADVPNLEPAVH